MKKSILAVILNWNETDLTIKCINSILKTKTEYLDILVIDNNSKNNPENIFKDLYPEIIFIRNESNLGVAGARNIGIKFSIQNYYDYTLFIDNDAYVHKDMLRILMNEMSINKSYGIVGPKILIESSKNQIFRAGCTSWELSYMYSFIKIIRMIYSKKEGLHLPKVLDTVRGENQIDTGQYETDIDIDFQIGCAQLIRKEVFLDIGLIDEDFSPYGSEDIDFCVRAKKAGWRLRYVAKAKCWHRKESSFNDSYDRSFFNAKNIILIGRKHLSKFRFLFAFFPDFVFIALPSIIFQGLLKNNYRKLRGIIDAVKWNLIDCKKRGIFLKPKNAQNKL